MLSLKYAEHSLYDYAANLLVHATENNSTLVLENHYRCHQDIIAYSNHQFYERFLSRQLQVCTDESRMHLPEKGILMVDIQGSQVSENDAINIDEANEAIALANRIHGMDSSLSIGIVTPFRAQADHIARTLDPNLHNYVTVSTVHGFQGDEKDVIIFSLVVTDNSPERKIRWIDHVVPYLVNVAVTRARQTLYVLGNANYIRNNSHESEALGYLIRCARPI